jgi:Cof subfamily protein (haloacid dehalogenase superfamily)
MEDLSHIQLVLSDLDESLLGPDHRVGASSKAAIARLQATGITFAVCTGRAPEAARPVVAELGVRYYICNNGASVHDGDRILAQRVMPPEVAGALAAFFAEHSIPVYLMAPGGYYLTQRSPSTDRADENRGVRPVVLGNSDWHEPAHKVMAWGGAAAYEECVKRFGHQVNIIYHAEYLEIAPQGVSKQWGGERLAEHLGIPAARVAAVGDARNDIEMVRWAGVGAAMGNADPLLKEVAGLVLKGHDEDGTADLFEAIMKAQTRSA